MSTEKTLPATDKRRGELRSKGQVPRSPDLVTTALLGSGLLMLIFFGGYIGEHIMEIMHESFSEISKASSTTDPTTFLGAFMSLNFILLMGGFFLIMVLVAIFSNVFQTGLIIASEALSFNLDKLNPINGLQQLFSLRKLVLLLLSVLKLSVILAVAYTGFRVLLKEPIFSRPLTVPEIGRYLIAVAWTIGWRVLMALGILAFIDYFYQHWQYEQDNRMSLIEIKEERKQMEPPPEVRGQLKKMYKKYVSIRRQLENMSSATIVVTNPTHFAVALKYNREEMEAPIVIAKGQRKIALRIKARARRLGIPMMEDRALAQGLFKHGQVDEPIPMLYYKAVATILVELQKKGFRRKTTPNEPLTEEGDEPFMES